MKPNSPGCICCDPPVNCETRIATTFSGDDGGGGVVWNNPNGAGTFPSTGSTDFAWAALTAVQTTEYLRASDFGFTLSPTITIVQVKTTVYRFAFNAGGGAFANSASIFDSEFIYEHVNSSHTNLAASGPWGRSIPGGQFDPYPANGLTVITYVDDTSPAAYAPSDFTDGNGFTVALKARGGTAAEAFPFDDPPELRDDGGEAYVEAIYLTVCWTGS